MTSPPPPTTDVARNARLGIVLFIVYVLVYAGFVALAAFAPSVMAREIAGVNVAIVYGFVLIVLALLLAIVYMTLCRDSDGTSEAGMTEGGDL
jgi:uncharacterized membrane protein (DUF485 family)